eukprot:1160373-Pelagomonas_calceolata.AAC.5
MYGFASQLATCCVCSSAPQQHVLAVAGLMSGDLPMPTFLPMPTSPVRTHRLKAFLLFAFMCTMTCRPATCCVCSSSPQQHGPAIVEPHGRGAQRGCSHAAAGGTLCCRQ